MTVTPISGDSMFGTTSGTPVKVTSNNGTNGETTAGTDSVESAEKLQQQFLSLLLTQLENQNPLDPVDTNEYTQQLVQYSSLEQQIDTNVKLDDLITAYQDSSNLNAFSYLNNRIQIETNQTAVQDGVADWQYYLSDDAKDVNITIRDSSGRTVHSENMSAQDAGTYAFSLDAVDAKYNVKNGDVLTMTISATDVDGAKIPYSTMTEVVVDGVETSEDGIILRAGNLTFETGDISKILGPKPVTTTTTT